MYKQERVVGPLPMQQASSLKAIKAKIRELESQAEALERAARPGIAEVRAIIAKYKLSPQDVQEAFSLSGEGQRKRGVPKGTRLQPKYRNPENPGQTWAGRGLRPAWLEAQLMRGRKLDDFEIQEVGQRPDSRANSRLE
jgi:DNA-binding protein H-NS